MEPRSGLRGFIVLLPKSLSKASNGARPVTPWRSAYIHSRFSLGWKSVGTIKSPDIRNARNAPMVGYVRITPVPKPSTTTFPRQNGVAAIPRH